MPDPIHILAFLLGSAVTLVLARQLGLIRPRAGSVAPAPVTAVLPQTPEEFSQVADRLGSELADLATGIEGHSQLLCEAIGSPAQVATQAQRLWSRVRKLRLFSEKVLSSRGPVSIVCSAVDVRELLQRLRQELEDYSGAGLQVKCSAASALPRALADREVLRRALLFLIDTLLDLETDAGVLGLHATTRMDEDAAPRIEIEIRVESEDPPPASARAKPMPDLGGAAARNLVHGLGGQLWIEHHPGLCSTARIQLEAVAPAAGDTEAPEQPAPHDGPSPDDPGHPLHPFGGILIVEDDPGVRTVVAREMEKTGRRVFSCADGAAARSLFAATPERFELLILDREARRQPGAVLAAEALARCPELKILLLGGPTAGEPPPGPPERCRELHKPFGINELRDTVGVLLGAAAPPQR